MANRLRGNPSPYLQQHQDNPVDWWPWGDEAFAEARRRDVPVFLSIGYATCHWCHVMAHESFEDERVAALLNEHFVCIKVDREERPDIDDTYMAVCQAQTGRGGWPLTVTLDHAKRPWFTGTYFPKATRGHHIGMLDLVPRLAAAWREQREDIERTGQHLLQQVATPEPTPHDPPLDATGAAAEALAERFDSEHGGFGGAPKFPSPQQLRLLLRHHRRSGDAAALGMVTTTLDAMAAGGIHDHVGGGFHRYSTDRRWLLPHFEKMLYDQATLLEAYTEAWQVTQNARYQAVCEGIVGYVLRDLRHASGAFFCAEDADSEGEEGTFYLWHDEELRRVLHGAGHGVAEVDAFCQAFGVRAGGNFHDEATGTADARNILHAAPGTDEAPWRPHLATLRQARDARPRPLRDEKVLSDWNGLWITALARAAMAFQRPDWLAAAATAGTFFRDTMLTGRLRHRDRDGTRDEDAFLDDHVFLGLAFVTLFEATGDLAWLPPAERLGAALVARFGHGGAFATAPDDGEFRGVPRADGYDGALPSGNSLAIELLWRLGRISADPAWDDRAEACLRAFGAALQQHPAAYTAMLCSLDAVRHGREVVVTDEALWPAAWVWCPEAVRILARPATTGLPAWLAGYRAGAAYVCHDHACQAPVTDAAALRRALA